MIGEIKSLHPVFRVKVNQILIEMRSKGSDAVIGSGMRTLEQQAALYAQGREPLNKVNGMCCIYGILNKPNVLCFC
jgi:hypothetical protein